MLVSPNSSVLRNCSIACVQAAYTQRTTKDLPNCVLPWNVIRAEYLMHLHSITFGINYDYNIRRNHRSQAYSFAPYTFVSSCIAHHPNRQYQAWENRWSCHLAYHLAAYSATCIPVLCRQLSLVLQENNPKSIADEFSLWHCDPM